MCVGFGCSGFEDSWFQFVCASNDFSFICSAADLVASSMFLRRLEKHEIQQIFSRHRPVRRTVELMMFQTLLGMIISFVYAFQFLLVLELLLPG